jgi:hypothetical protein
MSSTLLTPDEFVHAWGSDGLIGLPEQTIAAPIPEDARMFLVKAGLPRHITFAHKSLPSEMSFVRLSDGLQNVIAVQTVGPAFPSGWSVYWIMGEESFDNGSAWFCIHQDSGHVVRMDIELDNPISLVNTSVAHLATAILLSCSWSQESARQGQWSAMVDQLGDSLRRSDPGALRSKDTFWNGILDEMRNVGPDGFLVLRR